MPPCDDGEISNNSIFTEKLVVSLEHGFKQFVAGSVDHNFV